MNREEWRRMARTVCLCAACALWAACGPAGNANRDAAENRNGAASSSPASRNGESAAEPGEAAPADFEGTAGRVEKPAPAMAPATLRAVRTARHPNFDRVVFEFEGARLPGYEAEYVDRPVRQCGSGEAVPVAGDGWLQIRMTPAVMHTEAGEATVTDRRRALALPNLKEIVSTCDFEAEVVWVLGTASPNRYRVLELADPPRLVVDIKH